MSPGRQLPARVAITLALATGAVAAEVVALWLSVRLVAAGVDGAMPASPVVAVGVAATGLAAALWRRTDDGARFAISGVALIVAAPVTAFGGGCGIHAGGLGVFRSGVRVGIATDGCVTFLNGALLVLGYALLSTGLWLVAEELPVPGLRRGRVADRSD